MTDSIVRSFLTVLATVRTLFRGVVIRLEESERVRNVEFNISMYQTDGHGTLIFFLDLDFVEWCQEGLPIGFSLKIESTRTGWLLEEEVDFPDGDIDWCDHDDQEVEFNSIEVLITELPVFTEEALKRYEKIIKLA